MFLGHFGIGFGARAAAPRASLGTLFLAAQFIDLLWPTLLLLGVERVRIEPGATAVTPLAFERIETRANTLKAHRLIHRAQARGDADTLVERLFAAQFLRGENVGDAAVLARIAAECGDDEAATLTYLASGEDADAVREEAERAQQMGITGVPFFILAGRYGVGGAQPSEQMLGALRQALEPT